jgi:hypothetical protein
MLPQRKGAGDRVGNAVTLQRLQHITEKFDLLSGLFGGQRRSYWQVVGFTGLGHQPWM